MSTKETGGNILKPYTRLLACKDISERAREDVHRAGITIHKDVPGIEQDVEIVVITVEGPYDQIMSVWDVPREIQLQSRGIQFLYLWDDSINGYKLCEWDEYEKPVFIASNEDDLGDLDDHPF